MKGPGAIGTPAPALTDDVRTTLALAEEMLACDPIDIHITVQHGNGRRRGYARIQNARAFGECRSTNEAMALAGALLACLINGGGRKPA